MDSRVLSSHLKRCYHFGIDLLGNFDITVNDGD